ncbi:hypothetical protein PS862_02208 [Pseudomonas fluorescens]|uniref:Uncharacterized protein n=1 Tax=Pseudomonas fluorescens TaxID=294 RepID=A0A5E7JKK6_PSEFL|nr:hypothetical protein PS862_02208 [Pseudomonas fluorescens]
MSLSMPKHIESVRKFFITSRAHASKWLFTGMSSHVTT